MNHKFGCCLWLNGAPQETADFYLRIFEKTETKRVSHFVDDLHGKVGDILTMTLELAGQEFILLNGGPDFMPTPAISYVVNCTSEEQLKKLWDELSENGEILMPLEEMPEVGLFGWVNDRYGFSWQLRTCAEEQQIMPCILFANQLHGQVKTAVNEWQTIFGEGQLLSHTEDDQGNWTLAEFQLYDQHFLIVDSEIPHQFSFSMANSFYVYCEDQAEIDRLWTAVTPSGKEWPCGWMEDRYGICWQTVTRDMDDLLDDRHFDKAYATMMAMYEMKKIDIEKLRKVYEETN